MNRYHILREPVLLFLVGACLSISQFVMIRDFVTILYGEEVVIILVTAAFFLGLSIGVKNCCPANRTPASSSTDCMNCEWG